MTTLADTKPYKAPPMQLTEKVERAIVGALLTVMERNGFVPVKVWDGGEYVDATTSAEVITAVFAVDESTVHFAPAKDPSDWGATGVFLLCGNGEDIVSDWHASGAFGKAVQEACDLIQYAPLAVCL